jgi:hypothetical protein
MIFAVDGFVFKTRRPSLNAPRVYTTGMLG